MNGNRLHQDFCYRHPNHSIVGVCHFCLNQKLLSLAANQIHCHRWNHHPEAEEEQEASRTCHGRKPSNADRTTIFAFGTLINRLESLRLRNRRKDSGSDEDSGSSADYASLSDSFISIQFEEDGVPLWDETEVSNAPEQEQVVVVTKQCDCEEDAAEKEGYFGENLRKRVMVQHKSSMSRGSLRWRKRIGHLFQLLRWRRSSKAKGATSSHANS